MKTLMLMTAVGLGLAARTHASPEDDSKAVAVLDSEFQQAVKRHDVATIERMLHEDMILVLGDGRRFTRQDIVQSAREKKIAYEQQDEAEGT